MEGTTGPLLRGFWSRRGRLLRAWVFLWRFAEVSGDTALTPAGLWARGGGAEGTGGGVGTGRGSGLPHSPGELRPGLPQLTSTFLPAKVLERSLWKPQARQARENPRSAGAARPFALLAPLGEDTRH